VSAEQFDRHGFLKTTTTTTGGVAAGAAVPAYLAGRPDMASAALAAESAVRSPVRPAAARCRADPRFRRRNRRWGAWAALIISNMAASTA